MRPLRDLIRGRAHKAQGGGEGELQGEVGSGWVVVVVLVVVVVVVMVVVVYQK